MAKLRDWAVRPVRAGCYSWAALSLIDFLSPVFKALNRLREIYHMIVDLAAAADSGEMEEVEDLGPQSTPEAVTPPPPGQGIQGGLASQMVFPEKLTLNCI